MLPIFSDPDFTGFKQDTPDTSFWDNHAQYWRLTDDQWYVIARIMFREYIRVHRIGDMANADPDDAELADIVQKVRQNLTWQRSNPNYMYINWSKPIPWRQIARQTYYDASYNNPGIRAMFSQTNTPFPRPTFWDYSVVDNDWSYANGLAAWGSTLDTWEGYSDPINTSRYEFALDTMFRQILGYSLSNSTTSEQQKQAATVEEKGKGIGTAYSNVGATGGGSTTTTPSDASKTFNWTNGSIGGVIGGGAMLVVTSLLGFGVVGKVVASGAGVVAGALVVGRR